MRRNTACLFLFGSLLSISGMAQTKKDSIQAGRNYMIDELSLIHIFPGGIK